MTDKQINKWLRRRFSPIGWLLLIYWGLMTLLVYLTTLTDVLKQSVVSWAAGDFSGNLNWDLIYSNAWGYVAAILVGLAVLHAWKGSDCWNRELLKREKPMRGSVLLCCLVFCMGAQMGNSLWITLLELLLMPSGKSLMPILESVSGSSDSFSLFLYASLLAPLWEEVLFRGYILGHLRPYGKRFAIWCSAILFALFHGNLLQAPYALVMGLVLGYITVEYSLGWSVLVHLFNNLVLADFLTRLTASWSDVAYGALSSILFGGSALISIGILIHNRADIRAYRAGEWMDRRCIRCFLTSPGILALTVVMCISMVMMLFV